MSKSILTETKIKVLKPRSKPYKASDGTIGGLHIVVSTAGGKVFCLAYRFDNKWCLLRLGAWPTFTLDEARDLAREAKKHIATGTNHPSLPQLSPVFPNSEGFATEEARFVATPMARISALANEKTRSPRLTLTILS